MLFTLYCTYSLYNNILLIDSQLFSPSDFVWSSYTRKKKNNILVQNVAKTPNCGALLWKSRTLRKCVFAIGIDAAEEKSENSLEDNTTAKSIAHYRKWLETLDLQPETTSSQRWRLTVHLSLPFKRTCACVELVCKGDCRHATLSAQQFG